MKANVEQYLKFKNREIRMPAHLKPRKEISGRLYESAFMERITRTPIWVPQLLWLTISVAFFWISFNHPAIQIAQIFILGFAGFMTWTFMEYMIHRFLYHTETESEILYDIQYKGHGFHHLYPKDPERLAMPPVPGLVLSSLFLGFFYLIMGNYALAFFSGIHAGLQLLYHHALLSACSEKSEIQTMAAPLDAPQGAPLLKSLCGVWRLYKVMGLGVWDYA